MRIVMGCIMGAIALTGLGSGIWILRDAWSSPYGVMWPYGLFYGGICFFIAIAMGLWAAWLLTTS